jgi:cyanamide hydratase
MAANEVSRNGWTAVALNAGRLFNGNTFENTPTALKVDDIKFPSDDPIVVKVHQYAKEKLPSETYNHSMRVYYYGTLGQYS